MKKTAAIEAANKKWLEREPKKGVKLELRKRIEFGATFTKSILNRFNAYRG